MRFFCSLYCSMVLALLVNPLQAQAPQGAPGYPAPDLKLHPLTPAVYWVEGGVGNTGIIVGEKGVIVLDTTISPAGGKALLAEVAKITPKPVTTVILTHGDIDHIGGLSAFPDGVVIIAHSNTKKRLKAAVASGRSRVPANLLPNRTLDVSEDLTLEGVKVRLMHWAPAHTDGDLVLFLPEQKIVFTGDIFVQDQPRALIHREQQGSSLGWITTAQGIVALDAERFVVGHGEVQAKVSLQKRLALVVAEREQIAKMQAAGKSLAEIQAAVDDPPQGQSTQKPGGPQFAPFSEVLFQELTEQK